MRSGANKLKQTEKIRNSVINPSSTIREGRVVELYYKSHEIVKASDVMIMIDNSRLIYA